MTTCENCDSHEFTCAGCGILLRPEDLPTSQVAPSCSKSGSSAAERVAAESARIGRAVTANLPCRCGHALNHHDANECWTDAEGRETRDETVCRCCGYDPVESGSSEDEVIPQAAIAAGAEELRHWSFPKSPEFLAAAVLEAAMPHLRAFQIETQVRVGYELGRREAAVEFETLAATLQGFADNDRQRMRAASDLSLRAVYKNRADGYGDAAEGIQRIVREVTKGDPK